MKETLKQYIEKLTTMNTSFWDLAKVAYEAGDNLVKVREALTMHPMGMTQAELQIRDIIFNKKATHEEREWARQNTEAIEFAEHED